MLIILSVVCTAGLSVVYWFRTCEACQRKFDPEVWRSGDSKLRMTMVCDLLDSAALLRLEYDTVIGLLGPPSYETRFLDYRFGKDSRLIVSLNKEDVVRETDFIIYGSTAVNPIPFVSDRWRRSQASVKTSMAKSIAHEQLIIGWQRGEVIDQLGPATLDGHYISYWFLGEQSLSETLLGDSDPPQLLVWFDEDGYVERIDAP